MNIRNVLMIIFLFSIIFAVNSCETEVVGSSGQGSVYAITTPSGANIYIDDVFKGLTPKRITKLSVGTHNVKFTKPGYNDYVTSAIVYQGKTTRVEVTLIPISTTTTTTSTTTTTILNVTTTTTSSSTTTTIPTNITITNESFGNVDYLNTDIYYGGGGTYERHNFKVDIYKYPPIEITGKGYQIIVSGDKSIGENKKTLVGKIYKNDSYPKTMYFSLDNLLVTTHHIYDFYLEEFILGGSPYSFFIERVEWDNNNVPSTTPFDFSVSVNPTSMANYLGATSSIKTNVNYVSGNPQLVTLSTSNCPPYSTCNFNPVSGYPVSSFISTFTITTTNKTPVGTYNIDIIGTGDGKTRSAVFTYIVETPPPSTDSLGDVEYLNTENFRSNFKISIYKYPPSQDSYHGIAAIYKPVIDQYNKSQLVDGRFYINDVYPQIKYGYIDLNIRYNTSYTAYFYFEEGSTYKKTFIKKVDFNT